MSLSVSLVISSENIGCIIVPSLETLFQTIFTGSGIVGHQRSFRHLAVFETGSSVGVPVLMETVSEIRRQPESLHRFDDQFGRVGEIGLAMFVHIVSLSHDNMTSVRDLVRGIRSRINVRTIRILERVDRKGMDG